MTKILAIFDFDRVAALSPAKNEDILSARNSVILSLFDFTHFHDLFLPKQERIKAWQHWQSTTANLNKKREAKARAELQHRREDCSVNFPIHTV